MTEDSKKTLGNVVQIDEKRIHDHLGELVRGTVEETLNGLLDAEADALCGAQRYERSPDRTDYRAGSYDRKLHTKAGEVTLKMPKLRNQAFETAIIERYRRRVGIPDQIGHPFRFKSATDSAVNRPPIPIEFGHPFRSKSATP